MAKWKTKKLKNKKKSKIKFFAIGIASLIVVTVLIGGITFIWLKTTLPSPNKLLEREIPLSTKIYDRTGKTLLYEIFSQQRRTLIKLEDIPPYLIQATLVAEDRDFLKHPGFDFQSMIRAIIIDIFKGGKVQGGSTITQQFIKNAFLSPEKTILRKIKELFLAYQIEKKFSKEEILQMYFNEIPYGGTAYGVEAASQIYFQKSVKDLTLDEAALLAALPKAPSYYSPWGSHKQELINRRNYILNSMAELGYITQEQANQAKATNTLEKIREFKDNIIAPHFVFYVKQLLVEKYGEKLVEQGGLKVITTLDVQAQKKAEEIIDNNIKKINQWGGNNASLCSIDVKKGEILAMVGSADFWNKEIDGQVNVALSLNQPGSSFKPIVYSAAFEKGYTPETIVFDVETDFGPSGNSKHYIPHNYDLKQRGPVTLRQALAGSLNIPSVKVAYLTGINEIINLAQRFGYTTLKNPSAYGLSIGLGAAEVTLLEHTAAYSVFAREGISIPLTAILEVQDSKGRILEKKQDNNLEKFRVIEQNTARIISDILSDKQSREAVFGANPNFLLSDRPVAVKTGTTNDSKDAWAVGYTPEIVTGVWVGNTDNSPMKKGADGARLALPIWHDFMAEITRKYPPSKFNPPSTIQVEKPILKGEIPDEITLKIDRISGKLATEFTPEDLIEEKTFKGYHSILYWVDRDNPQGPAPENPSIDPQFNQWEQAIQKWLKEQSEEEFAIAPTEYDDVHTLANIPKVEILSLNYSQGENLSFEIKAEANRPLSHILIYLDDIQAKFIQAEANKNIYKGNVYLGGLKKGKHLVKVVAFDDVKNQGQAEKTFNLNKTLPMKIIFENIADQARINSQLFPLKITFSLPIAKFKILRFYIENKESNKKTLVSTLFPPFNNQSEESLTWQRAEPGEYILLLQGQTESGEIINSDETSIIIY